MRPTAIWALLLGTVACPAWTAPPVQEIRDALRHNLVQPPQEAALAALGGGDLDAAVRRLDPHARLLSPEQQVAERAESAGVGVGAALLRWEGRHVLFPYQEGPLARHGVTEPAYLLRANGNDVQNMTLEQVGRRLSGAPGSAVEMTLAAPGPRGDRDYHVVRGAFRAAALEEVTVADARVIRLRRFASRETRPHLRSALRHSSGLPLVMDLRDCPGGDLFEALDAAALFLPERTLLAYGEARGGVHQPYHAPRETPFDGRPVVLWVGPGTASACEIFAGILRHYRVARLVGRATRGKCSSQTDIGLSDGSVLRLTNMEVRLPNGESCSGRGLDPDLRVPSDALLDAARLLTLSRIAARPARSSVPLR